MELQLTETPQDWTADDMSKITRKLIPVLPAAH